MAFERQQPSIMNSQPSWLARHRGGVALSIALLGFILSEGLDHWNIIPASISHLCVSAFEGALVGSLADWFAVTALFKRIPLPLLSRHTGLIAQRREALSRGIVDMVENEWLSPQALRHHLQRISFADIIVRHATSSEGSKRLQRALRKQLRKAVDWLDDPRSQKLLDSVMERFVARLDPGQHLAPMLRRLSRDKELLDQLWHGALSILERVLRDPQLLAVLSDILLDQLDTLSSEGRWKSLKVWVGKQFLEGEGDRDKVERLLIRLLNSAQEQLIEIEGNEHHPLRLRMRALLIVTARHIEQDPNSRLNTLLERGKWQLFNAYHEQQGSKALIAFAQRWLVEQLDDEHSTLSELLQRGTDRIIAQQLVEPQARETFDNRTRGWLSQLLDEYPDAIGDVVRESLSETNMPTERLVHTIESRVGPDLQWIRVNGAIVGGAAALAIALIRLATQYLIA